MNEIENTDQPVKTGFIIRRQLVVFFALAFLISWGSFAAFSGPAFFAFGSFLSAVIVLSLSEGLAGLKDFVGRCTRWRVGLIWYFVAITLPAAIAFGALYLNWAGGAPVPTFTGAWYEAALMIPMAWFDAPLWEDSGWRGFAMPRFPAHRTRFVNTLILGILLAAWHSPIALSAGAVAAPYLITTVISAFLTNWIYYHARQSALLAMLYHSTANAVGILFFNTQTGDTLLHLFWFLAAFNVLAATIVLIADHKFWFRREL